MTLAAHTLENIRTESVTISYPAERLTEVATSSTPLEVNREERDSVALLITSFEDSGTARAWGVENFVGSVRMVGPSYSSHRGWLLYNSHGEVTRVYGAPLNPEPINSHHYRLISGNHAGYLMRYNDDAHRDERGRAELPWTIIESGYGVDRPFFASDGFSNHTITNPYVEVNYTPVVGTEGAAASPWAEPVPATVGIPTVLPHSDRRFHGLAERNPAGDVTLNPEPVPGKMYLLFPKPNTGGSSYTRVAMWTPAGFAISGYIDGYHDFTRERGMNLAPVEEWDYVQMQLTQATKIEDQRTLVQFKRNLHDEKVQYHGWQEALNELAEEHDWCGEYESAVHRLGVMDRGLRRDDPVPPVPDIDENGDEIEPEPTTLRRLYEFDVPYRATFELDSPSGRVDDALRYDMDISIETSSMRFEGSGTVRVGPISAEGTNLEDMERDARNSIDSSMVEEAINNELSQADLIEVHDFETDGEEYDVTGDHDLSDYFDDIDD